MKILCFERCVAFLYLPFSAPTSSLSRGKILAVEADQKDNFLSEIEFLVYLFIYFFFFWGGGGCFFLPISKTGLFKLNFLFVIISLVFEMEIRPPRPAMLFHNKLQIGGVVPGILKTRAKTH